MAGCGGDRPPPGAARDAPPGGVPATEPTIRVGVAWGDSAVGIGGDRWWIRERGIERPIAVVEAEPGWRVVRLPFERSLRVERPDGQLSEAHPGPLVAEALDGRGVVVDGRRYLGAIVVSPRPDGTLTAINEVGLETYLEGVVSREMGRPDRAALEALQAQAIAARTYALKRLGSRAELGFDVFGSVEDQAYGGVPAADDSLAVRAVRATRGRAILYDGYLVDAYYHSTCGGHTQAVELVFDDPPAPYLSVVSDARPGGGFWCQDSRYFRWRTTLDADELQARVERNLSGLVPLPPAGAGRVVDVEIARSSPEGRALVVRLTTSTGRYVVRANAIRRLFADPDGTWLRSTLFLLRPEYEAGRLARLTFVGGGWGHGVGMCQVGAMARARAGHGHEAILAAYYPGTTIVRLY